MATTQLNGYGGVLSIGSTDCRYPRNTDNGDIKQNATPAVTPPETAVLQAQVDGLRERLDDMKAMLEREREVAEREREQADKWRETAEHSFLTLMFYQHGHEK